MGQRERISVCAATMDPDIHNFVHYKQTSLLPVVEKRLETSFPEGVEK